MCVQWGGPVRPGNKCQFPFIFNGKSYDMCTTALDSSQRPWCPTQLENGVYSISSRHWGYCHSSCPFIDQQGRRILTSTTPRPGQNKRKTTVTTTFRPRIQTTSTSTTTTDRTLIEVAETRSGLWLPDEDKVECGFGFNLGYVIGKFQ